MYRPIDIVPRWVRISLGLIALINIVTCIINYVNPQVLFAAGMIDTSGSCGKMINLSDPLLLRISYYFASLHLAISLALLIVSLKGVPETIVILAFIGGLIHLQGIIIGFVLGYYIPLLIVRVVVLAFIIFVIKTMVSVIRKRNSQQV